AFYDKSSESIKSGEYYHYTEKVLRIELRLTSHLRRTLYPKSENLKAVMMLSANFKKLIAEQWYSHYNAILKKRILIEHGVINGWKEFREYLTASAIQEHKMAYLNNKIDLLAKEGKWPPYKKCEVKTQLK